MTASRVLLEEAAARWRAQPRHIRLRILSTLRSVTEDELTEIERGGPVMIKAYSVAHGAAVAVLRAAGEPEAKLPPCGRCGGSGVSALPGLDDTWDEMERIAQNLVDGKTSSATENLCHECCTRTCTCPCHGAP